MQEKILEYIEAHPGPMDSEEAVIMWWQGLQDMAGAGAVDDLTETLEFLEDQNFIEKQKMEKDFFIYRLIVKQ
jgi:Fe2+ or Zn2+ uptake regulation protein